jgi:DNA-binding MarR family transcriptional regulator
MKLEEAIHQKKFVHQRQKALINILYTNNWMVSKIKTSLKSFGITMQQYNVLRILRGQHPKPITTSTIRRRMLDKMSDASRIVDRLHKKELIIRSTCPSDKRLVDVVISEKGLQLLDIISKHTNQLEDITSNLTEEEATTLNELLDKIRINETTK